MSKYKMFDKSFKQQAFQLALSSNQSIAKQQKSRWQKYKDDYKADETFLKKKNKTIFKLSRDSYGWSRKMLALKSCTIIRKSLV